jgi:26S proteasome regulatory subunit N12
MYPLIGLNLLRLLSQNRLSDFHTSLETIDPEQLQTNQYIKQAVDLGKIGGVGISTEKRRTHSTLFHVA